MSFILLGILNSQAAGAVAGGASYDLLETEILASDTASVEFTGLGSYSDYKHLQIRMVVQTNRASVVDFLEVTLNGDTGSNYASHTLLGAASVSSGAQSSASFMKMCRMAGTDTANAYGASVLDLLDPFSTTKNTTLRELGGTNVQIALTSGLHVDTSAVSSVSFAPEIGTQIKSGSRFSLYGIKAA